MGCSFSIWIISYVTRWEDLNEHIFIRTNIRKVLYLLNLYHFLGKFSWWQIHDIFFIPENKKKLDWAVDGIPSQIFMLGANVADSMMDGWTDGKIMLLSHTLTRWESHIASLFKFNPCPAFFKQCRSRSVGFWRSQLIWICTVCHQVCKFIATIWIK